MHPAHTLPQDRLSLGAGVTGQLAVGDASDIIAAGRSLASGAATAPGGDVEQVFVDGALLNAALAPELAPWISGRIGLGDNFEGGLTYSGRSVRADARKSFERGPFALSLGLGASAVLISLDNQPDDPFADDPAAVGQFSARAFDFSPTGIGFDLPLLVGWKGPGDFVQAWLGTRAHFEIFEGQLPLADDNDTDTPPQNAEARATRWASSGIVGLAVGAPPVWVRLELVTTFHRVHGEVQLPEADMDAPSLRSDFSAVTLSPSAGLVGIF